jgi:CRISPR-associated exonuclease Cas4
MLEYSRNLKEPSRELRKNMTEAEQSLWTRLRGKQLLGVQFYRQKPIGPYIVDFYAHAAMLVIEVDGSQHNEPEHAKKDIERDRYLSDMGLLVLRFSNLQVLQETDAVVEAIYRVIEDRQIPSGPPLQRGEKPKSPPFVKRDTRGFESDPIMISALEHYSYCPRQCALIHLEQVWDENLYTMRGRDVHERVDEISGHELGSVRYERALPIWCRRLNLIGKADLVEFYADVPYPVEYKSGRHRKGNPETIQLCAQALSLEEMFGVPVNKGAIYWHGSRERREIEFTESMRRDVERVAAAVLEMVEARITPLPVNDKRCERCSLRESCLPVVVADKRRNCKAASELFAI